MCTGPFACLPPAVVSCDPGGTECQFLGMFGVRTQQWDRFVSRVVYEWHRCSHRQFHHLWGWLVFVSAWPFVVAMDRAQASNPGCQKQGVKLPKIGRAHV